MSSIPWSEHILEWALEEHNPLQAYVMFSGGHDSLATAHVSYRFLRRRLPTTIAHINTGIGIPETREFVHETVAEQGWKMVEASPPDLSYEEMVMRYGFPGPGAHDKAYSWLKERAINSLIRQAKQDWKDRVLIVTGVRREESVRRMGNVIPVTRDGAAVWAAPLIEWTGLDVRSYLTEQGLRTNPVVDLLHMSGECLCGAFAQKGELDWIARWFPDTAAYIRDLEHRAAHAGVEACKWGVRPAKPQIPGQQRFLPLCSSCPSRVEEAVGA